MHLGRVIFFLAMIPALLYAQYNWHNFIYHYNVRCLLVDNSKLWIGTSDAGLVCRTIKTGEEIVFDSDNGFIGDQIISVVKGAGNTIWAATSKTIASYNTIWSTYNLSGNQITSLTTDNNDNVWVACKEGIAKQVGKQFEMVRTFDNLRMTDEFPKDICSNRHDSSIYVLAGTRVFSFNLDGSSRSVTATSLSNPFDIVADTDGNLFVANADTVGVYSGNNWKYFTVKDSTLPNSVLSLEAPLDGSVWGFGVGNILVFNNGAWKLRYKHELGKNLVTSAAPLNKDSSWVGGSFLGFLSSDSLDIISSNTPGNNNIKFIYADRHGTIWTQVTGDNIVKYLNNKWDYENAIFGSLGEKTIKMVHTSQDVYYFLQPRDVLLYGSTINGIPRKYIVGSGFIPSGILYDLTEDFSGQIWFATSNGVIKNHGSTYFDKSNAGFASSTIRALLQKKDSTLWAGGDSGALAYFKDSTWVPQNLSTTYYVTSLAEDSNHCLWIGTNDGLINKCEEKETVYTIADGLGGNRILSLLVDRNNRVWAGTNNGLSLLENNRWKTFRRPCGIAENYISSIVQNTDSTLWIGTDRGISTLQISSSGAIGVKRKNGTIQIKPAYQFIPVNKNGYFDQQGKPCYLINGAKLPVQLKNRKGKAALNSYFVQSER